MIKLTYMRKNLLCYLDSLRDIDYQEQCWVNRNCPGNIEYDDFDAAVHFLFDDTCLSEAPEKALGDILENETEVQCISVLCNEIDNILEVHGPALSDAEYIKLPEWVNVLEAAQEAHNILSKQSASNYTN